MTEDTMTFADVSHKGDEPPEDFLRNAVQLFVRELMEAGAAIIKHAQVTFWGGYAGYFQDPDGHLWEIVWNQQLQIEE